MHTVNPISVRLTHEPINIMQAIAEAGTPASGAIDLFIGTARNNTHGKRVAWLEYEAYEPMALREMTAIAERARIKWNAHRIVVVHRLGRVDIGEASVAIAVSAAHRAEAFGACREIIDRIKETAPIWKKEIISDIVPEGV
jgi:molybdopterin synthase catalytic subunit